MTSRNLVAVRETLDIDTQFRFKHIEVQYIEQPASFPAWDLRETFATNLRRLRNARGWSQDELVFEQRSAVAI